MNIFVGNLEYHVSEEELRGAFGSHGTVDSARIISDRDTGKSKGFAFVVMPDDNEARSAMEGLNGQELNGRAIIVNEARPQEERTGGFEDSGRNSGRREFSRERERGRRDRY